MYDASAADCSSWNQAGNPTTKIVHKQGSMGDFLSLKKRDVVDRLRRRIERYRRHQKDCIGRFNSGINGLYDQHRQDSQLLRQRWLESRAKKAKHSKPNKDSNNTQVEHRNLIVTVGSIVCGRVSSVSQSVCVVSVCSSLAGGK